MIELQHIIESKRDLLSRETYSLTPVNYSEGMADDQKDRYIQYLAEQKELKEQMVAVLSEQAELKKELLEERRLRKSVERKARSLQEKLEYAIPEFLQAIAYEVYVKNVTFGLLHQWLTDMGMTISPNTLHNWLKKGKKYLDELVGVLKEIVLEKDSIVHCDETWCKVRKYDHYKKCYIGVLVSKAQKVVIFFYENGSRDRDVLTDFLGDVELKSIMSDGYVAYVLKEAEFRSPYYTEALNYLNKFWKELFAFLDDGELPIDNNLAERTIRKQITQRNNSLHYGSDAGAEMAATCHSVISTVKLHGSSAWDFIGTFLLNKINGCRDYVNMVPDKIALATCQW